MLISHIEFRHETIGKIKDVDFTSHYMFSINEFSADTYLEKRVNQRQSRAFKK